MIFQETRIILRRRHLSNVIQQKVVYPGGNITANKSVHQNYSRTEASISQRGIIGKVNTSNHGDNGLTCIKNKCR